MPQSNGSSRSSGAFIERLRIEPYASGLLDGLTFGVKDLIDVSGTITGCGNPRWRDTHPPATVSAVCVEQLLAAGAACVGKTISDELAFSLLGENHHYGTPLNPRAPDRVPGGSSSGSASAVACGECDFALGTDTGGSVRVPAANCGILGYRPSHGVISVAGVNPFAPTFDTVGLFARTPDILAKAATVLLGSAPAAIERPTALYTLDDAFKLADAEMVDALASAIEDLGQRLGLTPQRIALSEINDVGAALSDWYATFCTLQWAEIWSSLGAWVSQAEPEFGPVINRSFDLVRGQDRRTVGDAVRRRESYADSLADFLEPGTLLVLPTTPAVAPRRGSITERSQDEGHYYPRALSLTSIAGIGRLPQLTLPVATVQGAPVGLSLLAARGADQLLLHVALFASLPTEPEH